MSGGGRKKEWPQPRCGWKWFADGDPGWLVPRNPGLWDRIPLGFLEGVNDLKARLATSRNAKRT